MLNRKFIPAMITAVTLSASTALASYASHAGPWPGSPPQSGGAPGGPLTTLRTPLIMGEPTAAPFQTPPEGAPPAMGSGPTPAPVNPGMGGAGELMPWIPAIPSNRPRDRVEKCCPENRHHRRRR